MSALHFANKQSIAKGVFLAALILITIFIFAMQSHQAAADQPHSVEVQMRNVMYHFTDSIAVHIRSLNGRLLPVKGDLPVFDDKDSFNIQISSAAISITPESLANVLNSYVFARRDAPLKSISIHIDSAGHLKVKGKLHSKGDVPFETDGALSATKDGKILLHATKIKALHLPVKGLMDLLGIELADLIKTGKVRGIEVQKDDLVLDTEKLLPPPHVVGRVTAVQVRPEEIIQIFGDTPKAPDWRLSAANYMAYRQNQLRFGKLTMSDTDLVLIDMDPKDPFHFYLDHYKEQLVAGYTKETPAFGLRVYMRDYNKLHRAMSKPANP
ncbi:MAG TPA: hypothetical protein VFU50_19755 [Terriglobales bacterium]|nr:hypothetical protein [Terriglobales bacterium]